MCLRLTLSRARLPGLRLLRWVVGAGLLGGVERLHADRRGWGKRERASRHMGELAGRLPAFDMAMVYANALDVPYADVPF